MATGRWQDRPQSLIRPCKLEAGEADVLRVAPSSRGPRLVSPIVDSRTEEILVWEENLEEGAGGSQGSCRSTPVSLAAGFQI